MMARSTARVRIAILGLMGLVLVAGGAGAPADAADGTARLAEVNGEVITAEEVDAVLSRELAQIEARLYQLRRRALEALIGERLLAQEAARRGVTVAALLQSEVTSKAAPVTDQEVDAAFQARRATLRGPEAAARAQIRGYLEQQRSAAPMEALVRALRQQARVETYLKPPLEPRIQVRTDGAPARGPATAPVTIVEFSDFHCPFCKSVFSTLKQVLAHYGERVRLVYRDFPIDQLHPRARQAAEAARCARDQDRFWAFHDAIYEGPPEADTARLLEYARQVGADAEALDRCVSAGTHKDAVQRDIDEGLRLGVRATPTFFVNGRRLAGAQSLETFRRIIDDELESK
jgi:protein-disulfide isomerase